MRERCEGEGERGEGRGERGEGRGERGEGRGEGEKEGRGEERREGRGEEDIPINSIYIRISTQQQSDCLNMIASTSDM